MLKRAVCTIIAALFVSSSAFAQVSVDISDAANDIITIHSSSDAVKPVTVMVVNPGFTKEDAVEGVEGAIAYFNTFVPDSTEFEIPVKIMGNSGGQFCAYIKSSRGEESAEFTFYNVSFKEQCIEDLNGASSDEDITQYFENLMNAYGKSNDDAYLVLGSKAVSEAFLLLKENLPDKVLPSDADVVHDVINKSIILASFNSKNPDLCFSDDNILYSDVIGISSSDEFEDFSMNISPEGVDYIKSELMKGGYEKIEDIQANFKTLVHRGVLLNYKQQGYGHIHTYLSSKYRLAYEEAGFDIPKREDRSKYLYLLTLTDDNLSSLAEKFNAYKDPDDDKDSDKGSSSKPSNKGSVGGNFTTGGNSFVSPTPVPDTSGQESTQSFGDVPLSHWANKAVEYLKEKAWINGYDDGSFKPDNNITRAEYAKLILTVFGIEEGGEAGFEDVAHDAWYAPFVAAAKAHGIINGTDGCFFPDNNLTRQDAAVIICRIIGETSAADLTFADASSVADYAVSSVSYLSQLGVLKGYSDNTFKPDGNITRAEIAQIIYTLSEKGGIK